MKLTNKHVSKWDWYAAGAMAVLVVVIFHTFIFSDAMIFGTDMVPMGYMMRQVVADGWRANHALPAWNPYILCGLPVVDAMHGDLFYPASLLYLVMPLAKALGYKIVLHVWLAGIGMYVLLRVLRLGRRAAFFGGVAYMVAPYFLSLTYAGHDGKMFVTALFPLCVAGLEMMLRRLTYIWGVIFGVLLGLLFLTTHPQMTYFAIWGLTIYFLFSLPRLVSARRLRKGLVLVALGLGLGVGLGCVQFLPTYYYTTNYSPRTGGVSFEFASSWSLHPEEIVSLLIPSFVGYNVGQSGSYWGRNPFKLNTESPGPLVLLLALGGIALVLRRREAWPWIFLFVFCPLYALGAHTPLLKMAFHAIPGAKFLRAPSSIMFMFSCASSVLAALFVDSLAARQLGPGVRKILAGLGLFLVLVVLAFTVGRGALLGAWQGIFGRLAGEHLAAAQRLGGALVRDALLLALAGGAVLGVAASRLRVRQGGTLLVGLCLAGVLVTSLVHSVRFITYVDDQSALRNWLKPDPAIRYLTEDKDVFRVLPVTGSSFYNRNYLPIFGVQTANGFYDNRVRFYETLTGAGQENLVNSNIMRLTNVKYVVTSSRVDHPMLSLDRSFGSLWVYRNKGYLPRTFIVHNAVVAQSDSAALEIIKGQSFDPATTVVLAGGGGALSGESPGGESATIETYTPGRVVVRASALSPGYLFFSENYLPYWKAYVDGRPAPLLRADVSMRAVYLEPGDHLVEMKYSSKWYVIGLWIFAASCLWIAASAIFWLRKERPRGKHA
jgi:hypothetical protein